jgi:2-desacetyl-2-hydroxyethyl bacteriochlorophyllide A dehydrogenase
VKRKTVWFLGPRRLEIREEELPATRSDHVRVQVELTGVSAGTEMLVYRGELPDSGLTEVDPVIAGLKYPTPFGYCAVGRVAEAGGGISAAWKDRVVFGFQPHASAYDAPLSELVTVPEDIPARDAVFLANMETAVNFVQDAAPLVGERVLVLGQGTVGLLTAALLREFPLACIVTADMHPVRRRASAQLGVTAALNPAESDFHARAGSYADGEGFDVVIELSGTPTALNSAVETTGFSGRIIAGSWYGGRRAPLDLGGHFHRSRIRLLSSQVSTIAPELSGRWTKKRRFDVAWEAMRRIRPSCWITHSFPVERAAEAFQLLDTAPESAIQLVFEYSAVR